MVSSLTEKQKPGQSGLFWAFLVGISDSFLKINSKILMI